MNNSIQIAQTSADMSGMDTAPKEKSTSRFYIKTRYILAVTQFFGLVSLQIMRSNISMAVVAMVNDTSQESGESSNQSNLCPDRGQESSNQLSSNGIFYWNTAEQGLVLGCYFYGYLASNLPGGWLAKRFGMKYVIATSFAIASVLTLCSPMIAMFNFEMFIVFRVLLGFSQGVVGPVFLSCWGDWGPPKERSLLVSIYISGVSVGYFLVFFFGGFITEGLGWESIFYIPGGIAAVWTVAWLFLAYNSPGVHPRISQEEKQYILESTNRKVEVKQETIPWKAIFTSLPMYGIMFALFGNNWTNYAIQSMLPTYMSNVLRYNLSKGGIWSSLPYIFKWIFTTLVGLLTDYVIRRKVTSIVVIRKVNVTIALLLPALFIVLAGYVGCNATAAIAFFTLSLAFNGFMVDIAPQYSGIVFGICTTVANISGFLSPQVAGWILLDDNSLSQWQIVFWVAAGINVFGCLVYLIFGSGVIQPWAKDDTDEIGLDNHAYEDSTITYL